MKAVVGLGNPGERYRRTRHNVGFWVVEQLAAVNGVADWKRRFQADTAEATIAGEKVWLVKPQTFMNRSGDAVRELAAFYKMTPADVLVVCDDLNLPLGRLRLRPSGSSGGQNGLKSIIAQLGTEEFPRLRLGIGAPPGRQDAADYVLADFRPGDLSAIEAACIEAGNAAESWVRDGIAAAMNRYNAGEGSGERRGG